ncbi:MULTISPECIES: hypothetical protein [unclassified Streptomyces]|uniref:hypothetical protein n=1 Tax=unclassified Streptomyces TaxID=2593676 RepID=UPI002257928E|nr:MULTISPECIES: hypothetical protein [unclassified Streptomyces]MCX4976420.1 hypothetical protein [Streptomyces sp. NBC_00620]WRZ24291.1 hypothetical protein OHT59_40165 [Streptomyces sp. NBC_00243]
MTALRTPLDQVLASDISDRAFRLYAALVLNTSGGWVALADIADRAALNSHEARGPLAELSSAGLAEKNRRWISHLKTHRAYVRLFDATSGTGVVGEDAA